MGLLKIIHYNKLIKNYKIDIVSYEKTICKSIQFDEIIANFAFLKHVNRK